MKFTFVFTFLALLITYVAAQASQTNTPFYITSPLQGDSFKAGSSISVKWINGVDGSAKVVLLTGTNAATMKPTGYSFTINGADGEYDWKVPTNLPQDATFSLQISYTDPKTKNTATSYSAPFTLTGTNGDKVTQSFVTGVSSSAIPSVSSVVSSPIVTSAIPTTAAPKPTAASSVAASATPSAPSAAAGFKAPTVAVCVVAMIASALFL